MKCALVGNQNSGKTTMFNLLTGLNQTVGNWPGVTIERKEGTIKGSDITLVDLPGIYSLSPYTAEEEVSRKFVLEEKPDLIINIIDATSIERSLYLTTQLLELNAKVVIALNMADIMQARGVFIDVDKLSKLLHTTVVKVSALKKTGIDALIKTIESGEVMENNHQPIYPLSIEECLSSIGEHYADHSLSRFELVKIFERDEAFRIMDDDFVEKRIAEKEAEFGMDAEQLIASLRYDFIAEIKKGAVEVKKPKVTLTDKIDGVVLNRFLAIPIFILIMGLVYFLSVGVIGQLTSDLLDGFFNGMEEFTIFGKAYPLSFIGVGPYFASLILNSGGSSWAASLVKDGVVSGVGAVINFVPQLFVMFICLSLLETSGYMSRIAFFLDRVFKKFGLSGKSLIPFIVGSGCSVPGIMTARTVENEDERKMTILLTPFIPCSAKLPIIALFAGSFFGQYAWLVTLSLYLLAVLVILFSAVLIKKVRKSSSDSSFISELPEYHAPSFRYVSRDVWDRTSAFLKRAGTEILIASVIVWMLTSFTWDWKYIDGSNLTVESSLIAGIGNAFSWAFYPMLGGHFSWAAAVSALQGLIAKEQVISSMDVIAGISGGGKDIFASPIFSFFDGWSAYAYMVFNLFSAPCVAAIGAMRAEFGSRKMTLKAILYQISFAWVLSTLIGLIGWGVR
ncbi:MAG: ferrous iron transport protein B [Bacilli bacterium]|jgi:ferrous iron transport protein B|nr:ferrous iron transport protein B [Bacilli bacterium]